MSENIFDRTSEEFGQSEAEKEKKWQEQYGVKVPELCKELDEILSGQKTERLECLRRFLEREEIKENYMNVEEIVAVDIAVQIGRQEHECGERASILDGITDVKQLETYLQKLRFYIYRMEFLKDGMAAEEFMQFIEEEKVTITAVGAAIILSAVHPLQVTLRMADLFLNRRMYRKMVLFLETILKKWSGNQRLMRRLVEVYTLAGKTEYAAVYQKELADYSDIEEISDEAAWMLQDKLWRLKYGDMEAESELVELMEQGLPEDTFLQIVLREKPWRPEEYLTVTDSRIKDALQKLSER